MSAIESIRNIFTYGTYHFTDHLFDELDNDGFTIYNLECSIANGRIRKTWPKENKFEVVGKGFDGRPLGCICRITHTNKLIIITAYED
ncbi:MAG: hypothetical protein A2268_03925 [Candidatus Raymondbacteria bacterium RifOxyA12_full_50_37]|uniref:DUF4258 domain-containing protein n=1 Tax=Candidatus Raymondbacteria bacterium RIFOXYD12_FULL_49_13 TaxID=1817890 RepID=A0A1F7FAP9_UNCRA|nr:MAG: hypothetical protein A2268_03925 [Candidatus Raymondbacteria bacterium RifOxyA12_full_50_37]OGJ92627.1 MAG: hypothetical protein A2248_06025 [Candidatus Raymondbacteria bacterium RIFOXYA2_FULL_49_16]OGJ97981.1 MAG: hypothetical protein A2453_03050 [Candidatus Raymondbacteria bacterium RIFOXYC2_FULL_50_21]OGJ98634.1 MAG: hypothetical protein A2487_05665 [Candidatus Raymondbacteria bacterium RifOxyC12_full_50_8]OGK00122.1 MAG: hypothetical protein A2350_05835 [Candidatus Raymondbacteria b